MRIFSKKAYQFDHPAGESDPVTVRAHDFTDVPDWVEHSAMFKLAGAAGEVEIIGSRADELAATKGTSRSKPSPAG